MTALTVPVTTAEATSHIGKFVALLFDAWSLGLLAVALATLSVSITPAICEGMKFTARKRAKRAKEMAHDAREAVHDAAHDAKEAMHDAAHDAREAVHAQSS